MPDCFELSMPTDQVAIDNLADLTNAAPSLCKGALEAYRDVNQAANWILSLSAEQQAIMLPSNSPLSDLDAIAIKWQGASYARHNQNGTMTATMTSDHIRLHEQLSASGNEHLVCEISSLKLNGPVEDHEGQWQVAKKSRASARCNLRAKAADAKNNKKPDPRCRRVSTSSSAPPAAPAAQCRPSPSIEPRAPARQSSPATPYLDAARAAHPALLASSPLTVAATPTQAPCSPVETTPPVPVKAPAPVPRAAGCTGSLSGHAAVEDPIRAQAKSALAPLVQRSLLESLNLSLSSSLLPMAELRPPVPLSLLGVLSPQMPDGGLALLLPFPSPSEIRHWPSSQLTAPDAPLDAPPFSAAGAEAGERDEAEVARAAEAEACAAEAEVRAEAERTARAALEEKRVAKEESMRQAATQLSISRANDGAISENVHSTMLVLARSMQHEVLPTRQGPMRPARPILAALEQMVQAGSSLNNVFTAEEAHRGLTNTAQNHSWPAARMPPAGDPEDEADGVHPDVLLPCKWWKRGTCHYHGSHLSADGKTMYFH